MIRKYGELFFDRPNGWFHAVALVFGANFDRDAAEGALRAFYMCWHLF